jgi:hypothetical protein
VTRSARLGVLFYSLYAALIGVEVLWVLLGPRWFPGARFWADLHPPGAVVKMLLGLALWLVVAWGLRRRLRWAWFAAVSLSGLVFAGGAVGLLAPVVVIPGGGARNIALDHAVEATIVLISMAILGTSTFYLTRKDCRDWFLGK